MKKIFLSLWVMGVAFIVSACGANTDHAQHEQQEQKQQNVMLEPLKVEILSPNKVNVNQTVTLQARLTQGKEKVEDADKVEFEIWKDNHKNQSEMVKAKHAKDGLYMISKTFQEDGIYFIQVHATARGTHVMPVKQMIVGNVSEKEQKSSEHQLKNKENMGENGHHH